MTKDDALKIKAVVLYVVQNVEDITTFYLSKILYFANQKHLIKYGRPIINDKFCALKNGPVPSGIYDAVKIAQGQNSRNQILHIIADSIATGDDETTKDYIFAKEKPDMDELSVSDIECLNNSITENKGVSFGKLSEKSHDSAWLTAWNKSNSSPMDLLEIAKAGGANQSMLEYIEENQSLNNLNN